MCEIQLSPTADSDFGKKLDQNQRKKLEKKLVRLAGDDNVNQANGLTLLVNSVSDWAMIEDLKSLRKFESGRHRLYISGRHTDCRFIVQATLLFKTKQDDKPETKRYQEMIRKAISATENCLLLDPANYNEIDENA